MSAHLSTTLDLTDFKVKAVGTRRIIEAGTTRAVRIALRETADYARAHHPHRNQTGRLTSRAELRGELRQADSRGAWGYLINSTPYARFVEYGTKPHHIWPKASFNLTGPLRQGQSRRASGRGPHEHVVGRGIALRFKVGGKVVFARMVKHPGNRPMPFMQPAAVLAPEIIRRETEQQTFRLVAQLWE